MLLNFDKSLLQRHFQWIWRPKDLGDKNQIKKDCSNKTHFQFYEKVLCEKWKPKNDWECLLAERSQSEPSETKIGEDKNKFLIAGPKGQHSPDYNARTFGNSV